MAEPSKQIDEHIRKLADWRGELMAELRATITRTDPSIREDWKWDTPVFTSNGNMCAIGAFKDGVKVNFFKGASLPDPHHLFNSGLEAKTSRSIDLKNGDRVDEKHLQELVRAAVAQNSAKG